MARTFLLSSITQYWANETYRAGSSQGHGCRGHGPSKSLIFEPFQTKGERLLRNARLRMYRQHNNQIYKTVVTVWLTLSIASVVLAAVTWAQLLQKLRGASDAV